MSDYQFAVTHTAAGGLREIWNDVADGLEARGHKTARFALYEPDEDLPPASDDAHLWQYIVPRRPSGLVGGLKMIFALVGHFRQTRPKAVVTAMPAANVIIPITVTLARVPTKVFVSHHSPVETHNKYLNWLDGLTGCLPCVKRVISVSDAVGTSLFGKPSRYRAKRITVKNALPERIELFVDGLTMPGAERVNRRNTIVALGRLTNQKNYPLLIRAMVHVPDAVLEIIGGGEDEVALRKLVEQLGVEHKVRFLGHMAREAALTHAASADIFAQVSFYEGHSLALIEAARIGLPIVVSDVPVQVEGVTASDGTRCGSIASIGDPKGLGQILSLLLAEPILYAQQSRLAIRLGQDASNRMMIDRYEALLSDSEAGTR